MSLGHQTLRYTKEDSYALLLSLLIEKKTLLLLKKPTTPHPCSKQILLRGAEKSGCSCAKSKEFAFTPLSSSDPRGAPGRGEAAAALTPPLHHGPPQGIAAPMLLQVKELLYLISLLLVHQKEADANRRCPPTTGGSGREEAGVQAWVGGPQASGEEWAGGGGLAQPGGSRERGWRNRNP